MNFRVEDILREDLVWSTSVNEGGDLKCTLVLLLLLSVVHGPRGSETKRHSICRDNWGKMSPDTNSICIFSFHIQKGLSFCCPSLE